ncbi:hypothetical protein CHR90_17670 [Elstera cyanobacteriorum]|uniref:N-formylglutamate amidohydrolase n=1 Tax=Elstera cyanobacteriorum TaxID=2022747 RepID=A0A255XIK6_9PROT|nr:hypothetical protein CHR90_17670 [Elstera cyanobacteriorum]
MSRERPFPPPSPTPLASEEAVLAVRRPLLQTAAMVVSSPHSGTNYPNDFVTGSALDPLTLRRSEDSFVDDLVSAAPDFGSPLLKALFPRVYIDVNREPYELDPQMFREPLPDFVNAASARVAAGYGTIARMVATGAEIYRAPLTFAEAEDRVRRLYRPYHAALDGLVDETLARFRRCLLLDCHSMPSVGSSAEKDAGRIRADIILGDCHGTSCERALTAEVAAFFTREGFRVVLNDPFAGGFITRNHGRPRQGRHALQIEINRALYMNEMRLERSADFHAIKAVITRLLGWIGPVATQLPGATG